MHVGHRQFSLLGSCCAHLVLPPYWPLKLLHHGQPDLWPQGVGEGPRDGESLMANHPVLPRTARS